MFATMGLLIMTPPAATATEVRRGDVITIAKGENIKGDIVLNAQRVRVEGDVDGDLVVFSRTSRFKGMSPVMFSAVPKPFASLAPLTATFALPQIR